MVDLLLKQQEMMSHDMKRIFPLNSIIGSKSYAVNLLN